MTVNMLTSIIHVDGLVQVLNNNYNNNRNVIGKMINTI